MTPQYVALRTFGFWRVLITFIPFAVLAHVGRLPEHAVSDISYLRFLFVADESYDPFRLMIRPTENAVNDEFWVAIAGPNIDWQQLSASPEYFVDGVKKLSGLDSLEVSEMMTLNYYRYVSFDRNHQELSHCPIGLTSGWQIRSGRNGYSLPAVCRLHSPQSLFV